MSTLLQDLRLAVRMLVRSPGFAAIAVLSLALGIGAGTAVFSLVNGVLLQSLPVASPGELRLVKWSGRHVRMTSFEGSTAIDAEDWTGADCFLYSTFVRLREQASGQADIFGFAPLNSPVVRIGNEVFLARGLMVSDNFFRALWLKPRVGRLLQEGEDFAGAASAVISYGLWERHFALDPAVLGRSIVVDGVSHAVVGVLPRGFTGVQPGDPCEVYVPMSATSPFLYAPVAADFHWFVRTMARLRPGTSDGQLRAALDAAFAPQVSTIMKEPRTLLEPGGGGLTYDRERYGQPLLLMLSVVGLVILVACANLAGLSLARGVARQHELAVRAALGASRGQLRSHSLAENLVLALLGGGLGVLLAVWGQHALSRLLTGSPDGLRYNFSLDFTVLSFGLAAALATALLSGLLPALRAGSVDPVDGLKNRGALDRPRLRTGRVLVATQVCLSLTLLIAAGLYVRTFVNLTHVDAGFDVKRLLLVGLSLRAGDHAKVHPDQFYERAQEAIAALPGVQSSALLGFPLLANRFWSGDVLVPGRPVDSPAVVMRLTVGEAFFSTMGIPILRGRGFAASDTADAPRAVVVNESFVRSYLTDRDPIGVQIGILGRPDWTIVGVCRDARYDHIRRPSPPTTYLPYRQMLYRESLAKNLLSASIAVRTTLQPAVLSTSIRKAVAGIDPGVVVSEIMTQEEVRDRSISRERLLATLCGFLALLALLLSCVGLYGLMAYQVARRSADIAVRVAVGATRRQVVWPVVREALLLVAIGAALGVPIAFALTPVVRSQLFGVATTDPAILLGAILPLLAVAFLAAWLPARRAARVDPVVALRCE
jgi:predicted permease